MASLISPGCGTTYVSICISLILLLQAQRAHCDSFITVINTGASHIFLTTDDPGKITCIEYPVADLFCDPGHEGLYVEQLSNGSRIVRLSNASFVHAKRFSIRVHYNGLDKVNNDYFVVVTSNITCFDTDNSTEHGCQFFYNSTTKNIFDDVSRLVGDTYFTCNQRPILINAHYAQMYNVSWTDAGSVSAIGHNITIRLRSTMLNASTVISRLIQLPSVPPLTTPAVVLIATTVGLSAIDSYMWWLIIIPIVLVVCCFGGIGAFIYCRQKNRTPQTRNIQTQRTDTTVMTPMESVHLLGDPDGVRAVEDRLAPEASIGNGEPAAVLNPNISNQNGETGDQYIVPVEQELVIVRQAPPDLQNSNVGNESEHHEADDESQGNDLVEQTNGSAVEQNVVADPALPSTSSAQIPGESSERGACGGNKTADIAEINTLDSGFDQSLMSVNATAAGTNTSTLLSAGLGPLQSQDDQARLQSVPVSKPSQLHDDVEDNVDGSLYSSSGQERLNSTKDSNTHVKHRPPGQPIASSTPAAAAAKARSNNENASARDNLARSVSEDGNAIGAARSRVLGVQNACATLSQSLNDAYDCPDFVRRKHKLASLLQYCNDVKCACDSIHDQLNEAQEGEGNGSAMCNGSKVLRQAISLSNEILKYITKIIDILNEILNESRKVPDIEKCNTELMKALEQANLMSKANNSLDQRLIRLLSACNAPAQVVESDDDSVYVNSSTLEQTPSGPGRFGPSQSDLPMPSNLNTDATHGETATRPTLPTASPRATRDQIIDNSSASQQASVSTGNRTDQFPSVPDPVPEVSLTSDSDSSAVPISPSNSDESSMEIDLMQKQRHMGP